MCRLLPPEGLSFQARPLLLGMGCRWGRSSLTTILLSSFPAAAVILVGFGEASLVLWFFFTPTSNPANPVASDSRVRPESPPSRCRHHVLSGIAAPYPSSCFLSRPTLCFPIERPQRSLNKIRLCHFPVGNAGCLPFAQNSWHCRIGLRDPALTLQPSLASLLPFPTTLAAFDLEHGPLWSAFAFVPLVWNTFPCHLYVAGSSPLRSPRVTVPRTFCPSSSHVFLRVGLSPSPLEPGSVRSGGFS